MRHVPDSRCSLAPCPSRSAIRCESGVGEVGTILDSIESMREEGPHLSSTVCASQKIEEVPRETPQIECEAANMMDEDGVGGSGLREDQLVTQDEIDAVIREVRPRACSGQPRL
jgi:hypothetical protein